MSDYKFDRTAFKIQSFEQAERDNIFDREIPYAERLSQAYFLISQAYGFSLNDPPRLDRTYFTTRKHAK